MLACALFFGRMRLKKHSEKTDDARPKREQDQAFFFFPKDDNLGIYVENARRERGRASEGGEGGVPGSI